MMQSTHSSVALAYTAPARSIHSCHTSNFIYIFFCCKEIFSICKKQQAYGREHTFLWIERANTFHILFYFVFSYCARKSAAIYIFQVIFRDISLFIFISLWLVSLARFCLRLLCVIFEPYRYFGQATAVLSELYSSFFLYIYVWIESWHCGWQYREQLNYNEKNVYMYAIRQTCTFISFFHFGYHFSLALDLFLQNKRGNAVKMYL